MYINEEKSTNINGSSTADSSSGPTGPKQKRNAEGNRNYCHYNIVIEHNYDCTSRGPSSFIE